jgi:hypothetical protein
VIHLTFGSLFLGYSVADNSNHGALAPAEAVVDALAYPTVRACLMDLGPEIFSRDQQTPEALHAFQKAEIAKWWPIIKAANIKAE